MASQSSPSQGSSATGHKGHPLQAQLDAALADLAKEISNLLAQARARADSMKESYVTTKQQLDNSNKRISDLQQQVDQLQKLVVDKYKPADSSGVDGKTGHRGPQPQHPARKITSKSYVRSLEQDSWFSGSVAFSPDGRLLAYVRDSGSVTLWDVGAGREQSRLALWRKANIYSITFAPDGQKLWYYTGDGVGSWKLSEPVYAYPRDQTDHPGCSDLAIAKDGRTLALACTYMEIWSLPTFVKVNQVSEGGTVAVAFSPDSSLLASVPRDSSIAIRDAITCDVRKILKGHSSLVLSIQFSPDGKWLVSGSWDFTVRVWDVGSGKLQSTLIGHEKAVSCVKFLAEGNLVASGSHDETVRIWNWKTGEEVARFDKYFLARDKIRISHGFAISPDSSLLAFSSYDIDTTAGWEKKVPRVHIWRLFLN